MPLYKHFDSKDIFFSGTALCYSPDAKVTPAVVCNTPGTISTTSYSFDFTVPTGNDNTGVFGYKLSYTQVPCGLTIAS